MVLVLGLRKGEVLGLTWNDVDLGAAELSVGLQLQRVRRELLHRATKPEASDATLPLPRIRVAALRSRVARETEERTRPGEAWLGSGFVVSIRNGLPNRPT